VHRQLDDLRALAVYLDDVRSALEFFGVESGEAQLTPDELREPLAEIRRFVVKVAERLEPYLAAHSTALRASRSRYQALVDTLPVAMFVNRNGRIAMANAACVALFGASSLDDLLGRSPLDFVPPEDHPAVLERIRSLKTDGRPINGVRQRIIQLDGTVVETEVAGSAFDAVGGRSIQVVLRDVTEERRAAERIGHLIAMLEGIRRVGRLITRERSAGTLLRKSLEIMVESRGLSSATLLLRGPLGLRIAAAAGAPEKTRRFAAVVEAGGPPPCVLRAERGAAVLVRDRATECAACPGLPTAYGGQTTICLPLAADAHDFGVVYALLPSGSAGDSDEVELLSELASDVAFALRSIELESQVDRAQESLQAVEARLRALVAASPTAIVTFDDEGHVTGWSRGAERLFGWTEEEALGRVGVFGEPSTTAEARQLIAGVVEGTLRFPLELTRKRKDGAEVDVSLSAVGLGTADEAPHGLLCVFEDITARRRAERALRESAEQYRTEFEHASAGRCLSSPDGRILRVNPALAAMLGRPAEAFVGRRVEEFIHPDDLKESTALGLRVLSGAQSSFRHEMRFLRADGNAIWTDMSVALFRGDDGAPIHFITDVQDVTGRKVAEAQLEASEARYCSLLESLDDVVYELDREGRLTYVSGAVKAYGYTAADLLGRRFQDFAHPDDRPAIANAFAARLRADVGPYEFRVFDARGKVRIVRSSGHRVLRERRFEGLAGVLIDLTAQRNMEEQLRVAQKMEAVGRLAGGVAHDFNNLLTVINSYAGLAARGLEPTDRRWEGLNEIRKAGERAAALTRQLLAFSRRQVLQPVVLDPNAVITGMEKMLVRLIGEDVSLSVLPSPDAGRFRADAGQVEQVLMNLAVNARDAMPDGGSLSIEAACAELDEAFVLAHRGARAGSFVRFRVRDTGCGMDAATRERMFEPFFTTKPDGKGTGLGLATVYGIVKQSGGSIWVESEPGRGATFDVYFPRVAQDEGAAPGAAPAVGDPRASGMILFVEDDEAIRNLASYVLEEEGFEVMLAATGGEAMVLAERYGRRIHLVVSDVVMPGMSGKELASRLQPILGDTPVLFMSGYGHDAISQHGVLDPGTLFLPKPFTPESLAAKVHEILSLLR